MKKIGTINGNQFIHYTFTSIWEVMEFIRHHKNNPGFDEYSSETGSESFTGTKSYKEAEQLCIKGGDASDFSRFIRLKEHLDDVFIEKQARLVQFNDFIGEVPNVPLYLQGYPLNMIRQEREEFSEEKVIDIYFNVSCKASTSKEQIYHRGIITLSIIDYLESLGFKVNLHLFELSTCDNQVMLYEFCLKEMDEALDYRTLFFPMTHPSFLRRIIFKLVEKTPELTARWEDGYGRPAPTSLIEEVFQIDGHTKIIINDPTSMGIEGVDLDADMLRCLECIGMGDKIEKAKNNPGDKR